MKVSVSRLRRRAGFTLIELMMTCALIGVLAAIAIPNLFRYQARARRSEGFAHVGGIARSYIAYHAEAGKFPDVMTNPEGGHPCLPDATPAGTTKMLWDADTEKFFKLVGWRPDGDVYYAYEVRSDGCTTGSGTCTDEACFTITAHGDVDGNGLMGAVMYVHPARDSAGAVTAYCGSELLGYGVPVQAAAPFSPIFNEPAVYNTDPY